MLPLCRPAQLLCARAASKGPLWRRTELGAGRAVLGETFARCGTTAISWACRAAGLRCPGADITGRSGARGHTAAISADLWPQPSLAPGHTDFQHRQLCRQPECLSPVQLRPAERPHPSGSLFRRDRCLPSGPCQRDDHRRLLHKWRREHLHYGQAGCRPYVSYAVHVA